MEVSEKDYYFMLGYNAATKAYKKDDEYYEITKQELKVLGLIETWLEYSPYNFAEYLNIEFPENEELKELIYKGIEVAMDKFHLDTFLELEGAK